MGQSKQARRLTLTMIILSVIIHECHPQFLDNFLTAVMSSSTKGKEGLAPNDTLATIVDDHESTNTIIPTNWNPFDWLSSESNSSQDENYNPDTDLTTVIQFVNIINLYI